MLKITTKNFIGLLVVVGFVAFTPSSAFARSPGFYMLESEDTQAINACNDTKANPAPVIYSMTPSTMTAGSDSTTVTISGANLMPCSQGKWNGEDRNTTYVNPTKLIMEVRASDVVNAGQYLVTVVNPGPGGGFSNALTMTVKGTTATTGSVQGASTVNTKGNGNKVSTASTKPATVAKASTTGSVAGTTTTSNTSSVDLSANALNANNSFMPDTLIEWLILVVLIFVGIKLFRKMSEGGEVKHAH